MTIPAKRLVSLSSNALRRSGSQNELPTLSNKIAELYEIPTVSDQYVKEKYCLYNYIGHGAEGSVMVAEEKITKREVAIKMVLRRTNKYEQQQMMSILTETRIQSMVSHPAIPAVLEVCRDSKYIYIVQEYAPGETLFEILHDEKILSMELCKSIVGQLLELLDRLHSAGIVHGDIKPENIIYNPITNRIFLVDFGSATVINSHLSGVTGGSLGYMAPELLKGAEPSTKTDMWAVGVLLYILVTGYPPFFSDPDFRTNSDLLLNAPFWYFFNQDTNNLKKEIIDCRVDYSHVPSLCANIITRILEANTYSRFSAKQALLHPWFVTKQ